MDVILTSDGVVSTTLVTSSMEFFVILINPFQLLTNVTVSSALFAVGIIFQLDIHTGFIIIIFIVELVC